MLQDGAAPHSKQSSNPHDFNVHRYSQPNSSPVTPHHHQPHLPLPQQGGRVGSGEWQRVYFLSPWRCYFSFGSLSPLEPLHLMKRNAPLYTSSKPPSALSVLLSQTPFIGSSKMQLFRFRQCKWTILIVDHLGIIALPHVFRFWFSRITNPEQLYVVSNQSLFRPITLGKITTVTNHRQNHVELE